MNKLNKWKKNALNVIYKKVSNIFCNKYAKCKVCKSNRSLKCYYENENKKSNKK